MINGPSARAMVDRYANMSKLWNDALERFLQHLAHDSNIGSSYFFVDVHVSANSAQQVESASNSKIAQYNSAWNQFRENITRSQDHLMTKYRQINHSRKGRPQVCAFGINYDGYFDSHACEFLYYLSTIKYPADPNNRSYYPSRSRWILQFARQIQQAVANGAAPAVSLTIRNLRSHLSRSIVPRGLDPHIPVFQINEKGITEKHADNVAYESLNASGNIALQATPAYHYDSFPDNRRINDSSDNNNGISARSDWAETRVFDVIKDLFLNVDVNRTGIKTFYFQVKQKVDENFGATLDDTLWIPFVWSVVSYLNHAAQPTLENQNSENDVANAYINFKEDHMAEHEVTSEKSQPFDGNIPLSQIRTNGNGSVNRAYSSANFDTPRDNIDDISSTLTHTLEQDIDNLDNSSQTSESQSIDITSTTINNYVPNDSEFSLSIHTSASHSNVGAIQNQGQLFAGNSSDVNESKSIDIYAINPNKHVANDCESTSGSPTQQPNRTADGSDDNTDIGKIATRGRESDKCGSEKRRQKERKGEKKPDRKERRNSTRKKDSKRRNDSVLTDEEEDSIALRTKRKRRRKQQSDDVDDENTSYEY